MTSGHENANQLLLYTYMIYGYRKEWRACFEARDNSKADNFFTVRKIPESNLTNKRERKVVLVQL